MVQLDSLDPRDQLGLLVREGPQDLQDNEGSRECLENLASQEKMEKMVKPVYLDNRVWWVNKDLKVSEEHPVKEVW
jgi:hypothetical protein